ncbi:polysaccharide deacetylase family protein [Candidatus Pelagibacter sp. HIMB1542]|uniref:polysaccharide deacetylase family protein n=1 Tax=Candidatus Pelagibacter sp. HIMB1542 TaxID=3413346 RepID=UPI003F8788B5
MKSIMYHYVRNKSKLFPNQNILEEKKFVNQIKKFSKTGLISSYEDLFISSNKYLPTFDDGFKDHIYAAEVLKKYNSIGIFFIPTTPIKSNRILDVHKTHLILGKVKSSEALNELIKYLYKNKIVKFINKNEKSKYKLAYKQQFDTDDKKQFKKIMNYYGDLKLKNKILDYLLKKFEINIKPKDYYLNKKEIKYLNSIGMIIGSHSETHTLLSRLSYREQFKEINNSKIYLEKIINKSVDTFCYPYGGKISYNDNTLKILKKLKYKLAYSVDYRDISFNDIKKKPYELPRYDCNLF